MTADDWYWAGAVPFVGRRERVGAAERECWDHLQRERGCMVVVDQDHHIGALGGGPGLGPLVPGEQGFPVGLLGLAEIDRGADGRDVTRGQPGSDVGDVWYPPSRSASPRVSALQPASSAGRPRRSYRSSCLPPGGS